MARTKEYLNQIRFIHKAYSNPIRVCVRYYPDSIGDVTAWRLYWEGHPILTRSGKAGKAGYATIGHAARALRSILNKYSSDPSQEVCFYTTEAILREHHI